MNAGTFLLLMYFLSHAANEAGLHETAELGAKIIIIAGVIILLAILVTLGLFVAGKV